MLLTSVDWALRGATCALVVLIAATLLRDHGRLPAARLAALFAVGTGAYAITSVAGFSPQLGLWTIPLLALSAGNNVVFWALPKACRPRDHALELHQGAPAAGRARSATGPRTKGKRWDRPTTPS
jgi:hypothetical protein